MICWLTHTECSRLNWLHICAYTKHDIMTVFYTKTKLKHCTCLCVQIQKLNNLEVFVSKKPKLPRWPKVGLWSLSLKICLHYEWPLQYMAWRKNQQRCKYKERPQRTKSRIWLTPEQLESRQIKLKGLESPVSITIFVMPCIEAVIHNVSKFSSLVIISRLLELFGR
jgi:hypothetical protein